MALLDPADDRSAHPHRPATQSPAHEPTRHPMICLAGGFGFIIGAALIVHVVFNALI